MRTLDAATTQNLLAAIAIAWRHSEAFEARAVNYLAWKLGELSIDGETGSIRTQITELIDVSEQSFDHAMSDKAYGRSEAFFELREELYALYFRCAIASK